MRIIKLLVIVLICYCAMPTYMFAQGNIYVTIEPQEAIDDGAKWSLDGSNWRDSGVYVGASAGNYTVEFQKIDNWAKPEDQEIEVVENETTYVFGTYEQVSNLIVNIEPEEAVEAGAQWRVDGGDWYDSEEESEHLSEGSHTIIVPVIRLDTALKIRV